MKKGITYTKPEEKKKILQEVEKHREAGLSVQEACEKAKTNVSNYYTWKRPEGTKLRKAKEPRLTNLFMPDGDGASSMPPTDRMALVSQMLKFLNGGQ